MRPCRCTYHPSPFMVIGACMPSLVGAMVQVAVAVGREVELTPAYQCRSYLSLFLPRLPPLLPLCACLCGLDVGRARSAFSLLLGFPRPL